MKQISPNLLRISFALTLFCLSSSAWAQQVALLKATPPASKNLQEVKNVSLTSVLDLLQQHYGVKLLYREELVTNKMVPAPNFAGRNLEEALAEVLAPHNLEYTQIKQDFYAIAARKTRLGPMPQGMLRIPATVAPLAIPARAAVIEVTGRITSADTGEPLPGAAVVVKGTASGTSTDVNGQYSLGGVDPNAVLVFSYIGFISQEVPVNNRTTINVSMAADRRGLEEVVVIGYGQRERKDITGAISSIGEAEIKRSMPAMSPEMAMQGQMPGVFVGNPGSNPSARPTIRIRGVSTLGFNDPLYVVDGIPITEGGAANTQGNARINDLRSPINIFSMINPNDIESISVLKDASATAIYGVRASNGVILITTKRGKEGKLRVDVSGNYGVQNINKRYDVTSVQDYVALSREAWRNNTAFNPDNFFPLFDETSPQYLGNSPQYTDDWVNGAIRKNAPIQEYNVSLSGGTAKSNFAVGGGYANQENVMFRSNFERYSLFINSDHNITKWLKIGESFRIVYTQDDRDGPVNGLNQAFVAPWQPLYATEANEGMRGYAFPGRRIGNAFNSRGYGQGTFDNYLGAAEFQVQQRDLLRNMGSVYAEVSPLRGLRFRGSYSVDYYTNTQQQYQEMERDLFLNTVGILNPADGNTYRRRVNENLNLVGEFLVGYNVSAGNHNFDLILNAMDQRVQWNNFQGGISTLSNIPSWDQRRVDEGVDPVARAHFFERNPSGLQGYMGRLSYNYNSRYYLDATIRRDGSSKFGPGYKWGTFPSVGAAWRISDEPFMQGIPILSDFKIRAGWGKIGNQETRDFAFLSLVDLRYRTQFGTRSADRIGDGIIVNGAVLGDFPIRDMSWETVTNFNLGFDSQWLDGRVSFTAEYYYRHTDGILQQINIPLVIGVTNSPVVNLAQVDNRGFEFQGNYRDRIGELGYNIGFNLTTVRNRVLSVYQGRPYGGAQDRIEPGLPINALFGYRTAGIFQTQQQVNDWLAAHQDPGNVAQKSPGDVIFVDLYGPPAADAGPGVYRSNTPDGRIDANDRTFLGKTIPGYFYGINLGLDFKNFDLSVLFRGTGDVQKVNRLGKESIGAGGPNYLSTYLGRWTPENPSTTIPRALFGDPSGNNRFSDRFVENAGFLRLQNIQLGYNFRGDILNRMGVSNLRTFVSGSNLFVITPFTDLDPEDITTPTIFNFGFNLSF